MATHKLSPIHLSKELSFIIPGSKSISQRALILSALSPKQTTLINLSTGDDTKDLTKCLATIGVGIEQTARGLTVHGSGGKFRPFKGELAVGEGGTTLRFMLPLLCFTPGIDVVVSGGKRLSERPIEDLIAALRSVGASIEYVTLPGHLPIHIRGVQLKPGSSIKVSAAKSSQFLSSLLLVSRAFGLSVQVEGPVASSPYVDLTRSVISAFPTSEFFIESDWSSASFFLSLATILARPLKLNSFNLDSLQPDRAFLDLLVSRGGQVTLDGQTINFFPPRLSEISGDFSGMPDASLAAAVLAATLPGESLLSGLETLPYKECDRLQALATELARVGATTRTTKGSLYVKGGPLHAAKIKTYGDHRMAMAFAILSASLPSIEIENPGVVSKSFPEFWILMNRNSPG